MKALAALQRGLGAIAMVALAVAFLALVYWEVFHGFAAGSFGGAQRSETPGLFWFVIAMQVFMALILLTSGLGAVYPGVRARRVVTRGIVAILVLGTWALFDLGALFFAQAQEATDPVKRWLLFTMVAGGPALVGGLLYYLWGNELTQRLRQRGESGCGRP